MSRERKNLMGAAGSLIFFFIKLGNLSLLKFLQEYLCPFEYFVVIISEEVSILDLSKLLTSLVHICIDLLLNFIKGLGGIYIEIFFNPIAFKGAKQLL